MKNLFLALVAVASLFLTACSSCLGHTPTPGEAAPQAEAPDDTQSMVTRLDSLLQVGDGAQFYAILASVSEKMMEVEDTVQARQYLAELHEFLTSHQEQIDALAKSTTDAVASQELPGLVSFFSDIDQLLVFYNLDQSATDVAENITDMPSGNGEQ